ncbi:MAG TPA: DUF2326 domain-containing protein [Candidatus Paceibacterota bacterium]|nr:DUF2326 domain-containing protein [Candidatus Paceibacterota bacterium]
MIRLHKLYSQPETFKPISFYDGINIILGEKVPDSESRSTSRKDKKTNGVGKSLSVEFINFCLLKDSSDSRVMKIPLDKFSHNAIICLDVSIGGKELTLRRTIKEPNKPEIVCEGQITKFKNMADATTYLGNLLFSNSGDDIERPSFREFMGPLIRSEDSEFKSILNCYDLREKIPDQDLTKPHLYLFGINPSYIRRIKKVFKEIDEKQKTKNHITKRLTGSGNQNISDIKAEVNDSELELGKINSLLDEYKMEPIFQNNQEELGNIDLECEQLRIKRAALRFELQRIESIPKLEIIDTSEVQFVYNKFAKGLGDLVARSISDVVAFKQKIENYQKILIDGRAHEIRSEVQKIQSRLSVLDARRSSLLVMINFNGSLDSLKESYALMSRRKENLSITQANLREHESVEYEINVLKRKRDGYVSALEDEIMSYNSVIDDFNRTLADIHSYIMGNAKITFDISAVKSGKGKKIVQFDFRIPEDGSHSVDREKVFIYDIALMINNHTKKRHPSILVHDNIFDVDQDTLVQSLNFLAEQEEKSNFQYILTLNRDKIENEERTKEIKLDIQAHTRATFTRKDRFLREVVYSEID